MPLESLAKRSTTIMGALLRAVHRCRSQAGVANVAQGMVRHMQDTKEALRVAYQKKLPAEDERRMASTYENVDNAFNEANNALSE
ncbi:hypothetical protein ETB97_012801 [Aspergillus alliaceus]|uniref:Uncharacterized protein n=1 Tax=Petromyces alliaceus TaxID=209559 RepID=A0A8H6A6A8_PETAA|nr:hypothetical protein ETB97_012801 [Aspergillus burnettii]